MTAGPGGFAAAKINLCLHVTGRRADGYHLLDSVAVFASVGDTVRAAADTALSLDIDGPFGAGLAVDDSNLVLRAARLLAERLGRPAGARLHLSKALPVASGIGGGSADAAAALRLLATLWDAPAAARAALPALALRLGADVPVCLASHPARMQGVGEALSPLTLPACGLVLVNPGIAVATGSVFGALAAQGGPASPPLEIPGLPHAAALAAWLHGTGNDLQAPAIALCPPIATVLKAIEATDCLLARMSGSGASCFGLYATASAASQAALSLRQPGWWVWGGATLAH